MGTWHVFDGPLEWGLVVAVGTECVCLEGGGEVREEVKGDS